LGKDFPHPEGANPNSNKVLNRLLKAVGSEDAVAMTSADRRTPTQPNPRA
jgi:hypothetical protein